MEISINFYTQIVGMKVLQRQKIPETKGEVVVLKSPKSHQLLELNWYAKNSPAVGTFKGGSELDHLAFEVENFDQALKELKSEGYPIIYGPIESENAKWACVKDPSGIWLEFYEMKKP